MGKVISIHSTAPAARAPLRDRAAEFIDACYEKLEQSADFTRRPGQRDLSLAICHALVAAEPIAAQAPTGTGKTLAYLIGALAAARQMETVQSFPIVVATATVGLQGQIMQGDLPRLINAGLVQPQDVTLAKGRGRYFCAQSAQAFLDEHPAGSQEDFFNPDANQVSQDSWDAQTLLDAWKAREWSGDIDQYSQAAPKVWPLVAAKADTCTAQRCEHYKACPFFAARRDLSSAKIVVANHDLVLADLAMRKEDKDPLLPGKAYLAVFDEAHHLPDKALEAGSATLEPQRLKELVPGFKHYAKLWARQPETVRLLHKAKLREEDFEPEQLHATLEQVQTLLKPLSFDNETGQYRFEQGLLPADVARELKLALRQCEHLHLSLQDANKALKNTKLGDQNERLAPLLNELLRNGAHLSGLTSELYQALELLLAPGRYVRWAFCAQGGEPTLHVCPLEGGDVLARLLWDEGTHRVALVSATLTDFSGFDRFKQRCGLMREWRTESLAHVFPYEENPMYLLNMRYSPKQEERKAYVQELSRALPVTIDPQGATLVLFPSKALMLEVLPTLKAKFGAAVLAQGERGFKALVAEHKARVDSQLGSVLCGLATMAEGLDLPGKYCTHVAICALPFTVPTSPVELEQKDLLGRDYFMQRALPDALTKLTQMVGRLMRRDSDRGYITVYDNRLARTRWGRMLLDALPPYRKLSLSPGEAIPSAGPAAPKLGPVLDMDAVLALYAPTTAHVKSA